MRSQYAVVAVLVLAACAKVPRNGPRVGSAPLPTGTFIIAHTNDLHAHYAANRADWLPDEPDIGGMAAVSAHVRHLRAERGGSSVLYLDGGDVQQEPEEPRHFEGNLAVVHGPQRPLQPGG